MPSDIGIDVFRSVFDAVPTFVLDETARIVRVSDAMLALLGLSDTALIGRTTEEALAQFEVLSPHTDQSRVYQTGNDTWLRLQPAGDGSILIAHDVSEEWRALSKVATAALMRGQVLKDAGVETWRYDPEKQTYYYWDDFLREGERSRMMTLDELLPLQHAEDAPISAEIRKNLGRAGGVAVSDQRYLEPDGSWKTFRIHYRSGRLMPSGVHEIYGVNQDITSEMRAKRDTWMAFDRLKLALAAANAGIFEFDPLRDRHWMSPEFAELAGKAAISRMGQDNFLALFHPDDRGRMRSSLRGEDDVFERRVLDARLDRPGGEEVWVRLCCRLTRDASGRVSRVNGLMLEMHGPARVDVALQPDDTAWDADSAILSERASPPF